MASIYFQETGERVADQNAVNAFLTGQEVIYEKWDMTKLPENLRENYSLTDEEKQQVLDVFKAELDGISERRGYQVREIVSLSESTPNLDELLKRFESNQIYTEDEARFILSGHGIFAIQAKDGQFFNVELEPGDLIIVPDSTRHYFTLMEDRQVVAIRVFGRREE